MVGGKILPISAPAGHANASWTANFHGPSPTCGNATQEEERAIWYNVLDSIKPTRTDPPYWPCYELNAYASWANNPDTWLPYDNDGELILQATSYGVAQRMFVASTPWSAQQFQRLCGFGEESNIVRDIYQKPDSAKNQYLAELFDAAFLVKCRAVNASYTVHFEYVNGQQSLDITIDKSGEPLVPIYNVTGPAVLSPNSSARLSGEASNPGCSTWNSQGDRCSFDVTTLWTLAYQAVVDAFSTVLHGTLTTSNPAVQHLMFFNSDVSKTRLVDTDELSWVPEYFHYLTPDTVNLTAQMEAQAGTDYVGLSNIKSNKIQGSLATAIEDLFTNYTISLMSDPYLLPNYSSPFAPQRLHNVTLQSYHNVYDYDPATLWIAYGAAIGVASLIVAVGLIVMYLNGAAYDNKFSTVLRVSREGELNNHDVVPRHQVDDGRQPLPKALAEATLRIRGRLKSGHGIANRDHLLRRE